MPATVAPNGMGAGGRGQRRIVPAGYKRRIRRSSPPGSEQVHVAEHRTMIASLLTEKVEQDQAMSTTNHYSTSQTNVNRIKEKTQLVGHFSYKLRDNLEGSSSVRFCHENQ